MRLWMIVMLASLATVTATAGTVEVDIEVAVMGWADEPTSNDRIYVRKWIDEDFAQDEITFGQFDDLVVAAGTSCSVLATEALSVHGSFWSTLDTDGRQKYCDLFVHIADAD
jgi:hypothetical protein